jgi:hypothetical protein
MPTKGFSSLHQLQEGREGAQRGHRLAHDAHAVEDQPQSHHHGTVVPALALLGRERHGEADGDHGQRCLGDVERHDLRRERGADIGAEDDADRLGHGHEAGADEADDEHGGD